MKYYSGTQFSVYSLCHWSWIQLE